MLFSSEHESFETSDLMGQFLKELSENNAKPTDRSQWTIAIKAALISLASNYNGRCYHPSPPKRPTTAKSRKGEWICDVVWEYKPKNGEEAGCYPLAAESELEGSRAALPIDDFEKLLVFKAAVKILIFVTPKSEEEHRKLHSMLRDYLQSYCHHIAGEKYVFVELQRLRAPEHIWLYQFAVESDGPPPRVSFTDVIVSTRAWDIQIQGACGVAKN